MLDLLYQGGILFMGILTLLLFIVMTIAVVVGLPIFTGKTKNIEETRHRLTYVKGVGLFAFICGLLGQALGLYEAFSAIEQVNGVSPAMLAGGLRVSSISSIYGLLIFLLSYLIWFGLEAGLNRRSTV